MSATCLVSMTYEGINKVVESDLLIHEQEAQIVFLWERRGEYEERPTLGFATFVHELEPIEGQPNRYRLKAILNLDDASPEARSYLLKKVFAE